jgi:RNA polymerase sigma-70 factor (ECF subfamily)
MNIDNDEILVKRAQRGDRGAFEELVRRTSRLVYARLYMDTGNRHQAEDLLQETLLAAYRTLGQLEKPEGFRAWLLRIAQNTAIDAARRDQRQKRTADPEAIRVRESPSPEQQLEQHELQEQVLAVLRGLPEEYRLPITLRYLVGADYESIQTQMGLSNGSLRGLLHRGMQRLRAELKNVMNENERQALP